MSSKVGISIDQNDYPLLNDVWVKRVLFVADQSFLKTSEALQPDISQLILNFDKLFEQ